MGGRISVESNYKEKENTPQIPFNLQNTGVIETSEFLDLENTMNTTFTLRFPLLGQVDH